GRKTMFFFQTLKCSASRLFRSSTGRTARLVTLFAAAILLFRAGVGVATRQLSGPAVSATYRGVSTAIKFAVCGPFRELARTELLVYAGADTERRNDLPTGREGRYGPQDLDPLVQRLVGALTISPPLQSFDGMSQSSGPVPPDTNGEVGPNHYVQMVNLRYAVFNKTGTILAGPANINTLWAGFGGPCEVQNSGDPVVLYDQFADRWLLTQLTATGPTYYNCVALSTSPDPTGTYFRWAFSTGTNFRDYPKYAVWTNASHVATREFAGSGGPFVGIGAYALNRTQMIAGNPTPQIISFITPTSPMYNVGDGLLPTDIDGTVLP